jgi:hypothetical protein
MDQRQKISEFLYFGYLLDSDNTTISSIFPKINSVEEIFMNPLDTDDESVILENGIRALQESFSKILTEIDGNDHVVPLSGGFDSRGILACLINAGVKKDITTATFGIPGSWDYEIGKSIARKFGTAHVSFNLYDARLTSEGLLETARNGAAWTFLIDAFYNALIPQEFGTEAVYWSGLMGDALAGGGDSRIPIEDNLSWDEAKSNYVTNKYLIERRKMDMSSPDYNAVDSLPSKPFADQKRIGYFDQFCFFILNANYFKRVITFKGYNYQLPYCSPDWVRFSLQLPRRYRLNKCIYKKILSDISPELFSIQFAILRGGKLTDSSLRIYSRRALHRLRSMISPLNPAWNRLGIYRMLQYMDFDDAVRSREDYRLTVKENINDLKQRKLIDWIDIDGIWKDHQDNRANYGVSLLLLTALEISLKVDDENSSMAEGQ